MRICEMSSSEFSESVDIRFDPQQSAVLEEMKLRTNFNTLYHTNLNNTDGFTGSSSQAFRTDQGLLYIVIIIIIILL